MPEGCLTRATMKRVSPPNLARSKHAIVVGLPEGHSNYDRLPGRNSVTGKPPSSVWEKGAVNQCVFETVAIGTGAVSAVSTGQGVRVQPGGHAPYLFVLHLGTCFL